MQESEAYNAHQQEKARLNKPKSDRQKYESRIRSLKASLELQEANTNQSAFREQLKSLSRLLRCNERNKRRRISLL